MLEFGGVLFVEGGLVFVLFTEDSKQLLSCSSTIWLKIDLSTRVTFLNSNR
jgi:hypothetical protein